MMNKDDDLIVASLWGLVLFACVVSMLLLASMH
jgi:hypothetical protein